MILTNSQFYDVVQYGEKKGLDPKLLVHVVHGKGVMNLLWSKAIGRLYQKPHSGIHVKGTSFSLKIKSTFLGQKMPDSLLSKYLLVGVDSYKSFGNHKRFFLKGQHDTYFELTFSPGHTHLIEVERQIGFKEDFSWDIIFRLCKVWVDNLARELRAVESLKRINMIPESFFERGSGIGGDHYSGSESDAIRRKVLLLKNRVTTEIPLDKDQMAIIIEKLDELSDKVDKVNQFDFRTLYLGLLTNIASSVLYDCAPAFWGIVTAVFNGGKIGPEK